MVINFFTPIQVYLLILRAYMMRKNPEWVAFFPVKLLKTVFSAFNVNFRLNLILRRYGRDAMHCVSTIYQWHLRLPSLRIGNCEERAIPNEAIRNSTLFYALFFSGLLRLAPRNDGYAERGLRLPMTSALAVIANLELRGTSNSQWNNPEMDLFYALFFWIASACASQWRYVERREPRRRLHPSASK
jgi:hypothetical protein